VLTSFAVDRVVDALHVATSSVRERKQRDLWLRDECWPSGSSTRSATGTIRRFAA